MRDKVFEKVQTIFRDIFDDEEMIITNELSSKDVEDWDSLEQILLLTSMEKTFSISFGIDEVGQLKNVGEMVDLIVEKVENR